MNIQAKRKGNLEIRGLKAGDTYIYIDKADNSVYKLIEGNGLSQRASSRYSVNLNSGWVEEPGTACRVALVNIPTIEAHEV